MRRAPWSGPAILALLGAALIARPGQAEAPRGTAEDAAFLTRLSFGVAPGDLAALARRGRDAWVHEQLGDLSDPALDRALTRWPTLTMSPGELRERFPYPKGPRPDPEDRLGREMRRDARQAQRTPLHERAAARITRAILARAQLRERVVSFWLDHFNVYPRKTPAMGWLVGSYEDTVRAHALGRFRDLLGAVAHSPAMLVYLDNTRNAAGEGARGDRGLNENYARELLELHTLGVDAGYTQEDVREVARVLTGWGVVMDEERGEPGSFRFRPHWHDRDRKHLLGVDFPAGGLEDEGEALLDLLARHPATVRRLSGRLCRAFVGAPTPAMADRVEAVWTNTDGDLAQVVAAIATDPDVLRGAPARSPLEWLAAATRAVDPSGELDPTDAGLLEDMGQSVLGALPPTGYDDVDWLSSDALLRRAQAAEALGERLGPALVRDGVDTPEEIVARFLPAHVGDAALADRLRGPVRPAELAARAITTPEFQRR